MAEAVGKAGLHAVQGRCDLCSELCDPETQELNALDCTYAPQCPPECAVYHQDCLARYLKTIRLEKNRKTGFKCPRGCGKLSAYSEPCPGKIDKSHPIHVRNDNAKKRRKAKLPEQMLEPTPRFGPAAKAARAKEREEEAARAAKEKHAVAAAAKAAAKPAPAVASREQLAKDREAKAAADRERIAAAATAAKRELQAKLGGGKGAASQQHQQQQQQHQAAAAQERTLDDFEKARAAKQSAKVDLGAWAKLRAPASAAKAAAATASPTMSCEQFPAMGGAPAHVAEAASVWNQAKHAAKTAAAAPPPQSPKQHQQQQPAARPPPLPPPLKASPTVSGPSAPSTAGTSLMTTPSLTSEDAMSEEAVLGPRLTNAQRKNLRRQEKLAAKREEEMRSSPGSRADAGSTAHASPASSPSMSASKPPQEGLSPSPLRSGEISSMSPTVPLQLQLQQQPPLAAGMGRGPEPPPAVHFQQQPQQQQPPWPPPPPPSSQLQHQDGRGSGTVAGKTQPDVGLALACVHAVAAFVAQRMADDLRSLGFEEWQAAAAVQVHGSKLESAMAWLLQGRAETLEDATHIVSTAGSPQLDVGKELQQVEAASSQMGLPLDDVCRSIVAHGGDVQSAIPALFEQRERAEQDRASAALAAQLESTPSPSHAEQLQQQQGSAFGGFGPISEDGGLHKSFDGLSLRSSVVGRPEYAVSGSGGTVDLDHLLSSSRSSAGGEVPWPHSSFDGSLGGATPRRSSDGPSLFADHRPEQHQHGGTNDNGQHGGFQKGLGSTFAPPAAYSPQPPLAGAMPPRSPHSFSPGFSAQQAGQHMGFTNPFGRASQDGLFGVEGNHLRGDSFTMRASSTGSGLERFYSALSTQPSWNNGVAGAPGSGWSSPGGGAWASGPFSAPQLDLPLISLRQQQQEVPAAALMAAAAIAGEPTYDSNTAASPVNLPEDLDLHALVNTLMCR